MKFFYDLFDKIKYFLNRSEDLTKIKQEIIKPNVNKKDIYVEEIIGEQKIFGNQGVIKNIYKFKNGKVISCLNIDEYYSEDFQKIMMEDYQDKKFFKNYKIEENKIIYEWSDSVFKLKGKGATPYEIKKFLKSGKFKVKIKYKKNYK